MWVTVDPGNRTVACLRRCLISLPPSDVWVLGLTIFCLPSSSPPLSDHSRVSVSSLSEFGPQSLRFWLRSIPSTGDGFAALWQVVEEAIHLAAKDVCHDRLFVPEAHVPLHFVHVSQVLRAVLVGKWAHVCRLLGHAPHWGISSHPFHERILADLRRLFSQLYESKFLIESEGRFDTLDAAEIHRVDLPVFLLKRWRAHCVLRVESPLLSVDGNQIGDVSSEAMALRDH